MGEEGLLLLLSFAILNPSNVRLVFSLTWCPSMISFQDPVGSKAKSSVLDLIFTLLPSFKMSFVQLS